MRAVLTLQQYTSCKTSVTPFIPHAGNAVVASLLLIRVQEQVKMVVCITPSAVMAASSQYIKPLDYAPSYGTAGFRTRSHLLDSTLFRCGILAGLRALKTGSTIGIMVTASHNPEEDNGVKLVEPSGAR